MKKSYIFITIFFLSFLSFGQAPFISEIHVVTGVEVTGLTNTSLNGYTISVYDQFGGSLSTVSLSGNLTGGTGSLSAKNFNVNNLEYVPFFFWGTQIRGRVIVLRNNGVVVQAVSYGNRWLSPPGVPNSSIFNIGSQPNSTNGNPPDSTQFTTNGGWQEGIPSSKGGVNAGQTLSVVKNQIEGFAMYPNPVSNGQLNISSSSWADKQVEIYSISGQQVYNKLVQNKEVIDIYNLNKGIYLVRIQEEGKISTRKLIVN
tara:strand:- start:207 stop:977 length:771 start_codon:yes stop_codon:yes gene_type:complete